MGNPKDEADSRNFRNILILSCGFMLLMAAWLTAAGIEKTILQSVYTDDPSFTADGYISQGIVNAFFAIINFLAPTIVHYVGVRTTLSLGAWFYAIFIASLLYPRSWLLYPTSACIGFGAANVWVANGVYFTWSSTKETIGKYLGIYWAIMSAGQLLGNAFVFWKFQGMNHIDHETRFLVISILTGLAVLASITFACLGEPRGNKTDAESGEKDENDRAPKSICATITQPFRLFANKNMMLLIPTAMYNGIELAFFTAIYPTAVGFSEAFGGDTRKLVGFAGILTGLGNLVGGLFFGVFVAKFVKSSRKFIVTCSCIGHCCCFVLMYLNLPNAAPLEPTLDTSWINPPSIYIAMLCAFILGMGDGCLSTQMCAAIGVIWTEDPSSAHAIYRFTQAATCAAAYAIGSLTGLYNQILIFCAITVLGTFTFHANERLIAKMDEYPVKIKEDIMEKEKPPVEFD